MQRLFNFEDKSVVEDVQEAQEEKCIRCDNMTLYTFCLRCVVELDFLEQIAFMDKVEGLEQPV